MKQMKKSTTLQTKTENNCQLNEEFIQDNNQFSPISIPEKASAEEE